MRGRHVVARQEGTIDKKEGATGSDEASATQQEIKEEVQPTMVE